jgi:hypothetical protein
MFKLVFYVAIAVAGGYCLFVKDFGGRSIAGHVTEIWGSDLVQKKMDSFKQDMRQDLEERLAKANAEKGAADTGKRDGRDYINDADRESLSALIEKKTKKK